MKKYICRIESNSSYAREYEVETASAYKAAQELGCREGGEVVQIVSKVGKVISEARWTPEDGGRYYRCCI